MRVDKYDFYLFLLEFTPLHFMCALWNQNDSRHVIFLPVFLLAFLFYFSNGGDGASFFYEFHRAILKE